MIFPKVSIITVVYNAKKQLEETLLNLEEVDYPNKEIIVVDGGSTDGTRSVIEHHFLNITRWISEPDKGIYDAMNKGLAMATGDYVWFINAGDKVYDSHVLEHIFKGQEHLYDIYYGDTAIVDPEGKTLGLRRKRPSRRLSWRSFQKGMTVCHQSIIVKRKIAPKYDLSYRYSADFDWVIRTLKSKPNIINTKLILSSFETGGATSKNHIKSLKERFEIMSKYYGLLTTIACHCMFVFNIFKPRYRKIRTK